MQIFCTRLAELRKLHGFTQRYIADYIGLSQPSYLRYETGTAEPSQENLVKIADLFDVSLDYLLGRNDF
jgi:transcriptional regulator with XRE-family HTH domain